MIKAKSLLRKAGLVPLVILALSLLIVSAFAGGKTKPVGSSTGNDSRDDGGSTGPESGQVVICGDMNGDEIVDMMDLDFFIDFYFNFGPAPVAAEVGDLNCDARNDIADIVFLASFLNGDVTDICCGGGYPGKEGDNPGPKDKETNSSDKTVP